MSTRVAVIGAGPGGYAAAFHAADKGMKVTLVDADPNPGGVCTFRGCIPSRALLHAAKVISLLSESLTQVRARCMLKAAMPVDVVNSVVIRRPVADVSQFAADPDNAALWYENIKSVEWKTPRPVQIGSQIDFVAHFLGRRLAYTYEVVEFVPGKRLTMRTPGAPFPMETTYTWEDENGATRMTLRNRGTPSGFSAWFAPVMSLMVGRANRKDLALLKRRLEEKAS